LTSASALRAGPPAGVQLGGLDLAAYCESMGKTVRLAGPIVGPDAARHWRCSSAPVATTPACQWTYPGTNAVAYLPNVNNAYSWTCYAGGPVEGTEVSCDLIFGPPKYDRCTATVGGGTTPPTGAVTFKSALPGVFTVGNKCTLAPMTLFTNRSDCSVEFLPASFVDFPSITATYPGDSHHPASSGHTHRI